MTLIDNARNWWRLWSVRFMGAALAVDGLSLLPLIGFVPDNLFPPALINTVQAALLLCALVARFIKQREKP
jgi:hypothetical protein